MKSYVNLLKVSALTRTKSIHTKVASLFLFAEQDPQQTVSNLLNYININDLVNKAAQVAGLPGELEVTKLINELSHANKTPRLSPGLVGNLKHRFTNLLLKYDVA